VPVSGYCQRGNKTLRFMGREFFTSDYELLTDYCSVAIISIKNLILESSLFPQASRKGLIVQSIGRCYITVTN
jgi:hypothetical protein